MGAAAAPAHAAPVSGSSSDPVGDSRDAAFDITGVASTYDPTGRWSVEVSFARPLPESGTGPMLSASILDDPTGACGTETTSFASLSGGIGGGDSMVLFGPPADDLGSYAGARSVSADRQSITFSASDPRLEHYVAPCVTVKLIASGMQPTDVLDAPLTFPSPEEPPRDGAPVADPPSTTTDQATAPSPGTTTPVEEPPPAQTTPPVDQAPAGPDGASEEPPAVPDPPATTSPSTTTPSTSPAPATTPTTTVTTPATTTPVASGPPPAQKPPASAPTPTSSSPAPAPVPPRGGTSTSPAPAPVTSTAPAAAPAPVASGTAAAVHPAATATSPTPGAPAPAVAVSNAQPTLGLAGPTAFDVRPSTSPTRLRELVRSGLVVVPGCTVTCRVSVGVAIAGTTARKLRLARATKTSFVVGQARSSGVSPVDGVTVAMAPALRKALATQRSIRLVVLVTAASGPTKLRRTIAVTVRR